MKVLSLIPAALLTLAACKETGGGAPAKPASTGSLLEPAKATAKAPEKYSVKLDTTKGEIVIDVTRAWAPNGADRFYNLVKLGYYNDVAFFRVIKGFMAQVGIHGDPAVNKVWRVSKIPDDKVTQQNLPNTVSFATSGPNSRTTQFFINFKDNSNLDRMGFAPFGKLRDAKSIENFNKLNGEYGEGAPRGRGPSQGAMQTQGNPYLKKSFPNLDYITRATVIE